MNIKSTLKLTSALVIAGSLAACGGEDVPLQIAEEFVAEASQYDADGDGALSTAEMSAAWNGMSGAQQSALAAQFNVDVMTIAKYFSGSELTEAELETFTTVVEVEKLVEVIKTVEVEVEVIKEVEKIVKVEVPGETVYVDREVEVVKEVEVIKEVEVPGEIVYVDRVIEVPGEPIIKEVAVTTKENLIKDTFDYLKAYDPEGNAELTLAHVELMFEEGGVETTTDLIAFIYEGTATEELDIAQNVYGAIKDWDNGDYLNETKAQIAAAHSRGWTGSGITISAIDSGWHGDYVQSVIGNVAIDADIQVVDHNNTYLSDGSLSGYDAAELARLKNSDIVNASIGNTYAPEYQTIEQDAWAVVYQQGFTQNLNALLEEGTLFVVSSGNEGNTCATETRCNGYALAALRDESVVNDSTIVVGSIADDGLDFEESALFENSSYTTRAGLTMDSYLLAPTPDEGWVGTSYAAPFVAGVGALLMDKWDNTSGELARTIMLETADDIGAPGVDPIYGHGVLNVGRALSPLGDIR